jgi:predicted MFS family arabinose efflux permease
VGGALLLILGPNIFGNPFGFHSIFLAVAAIATAVYAYWRILSPSRQRETPR